VSISLIPMLPTTEKKKKKKKKKKIEFVVCFREFERGTARSLSHLTAGWSKNMSIKLFYIFSKLSERTFSRVQCLAAR
jgi:hypothetical protein